jgi:hypothetical protein
VSSEQPIHVEKVERVDVTQGVDGHLPYHKIIAAVTAAILVGFGAVTWAVLSGEAGEGIDAATKGSIIQTWNNLAVAAATFWVGLSLAGKMTGKKP